jgi:hypothetical protein
MVGVGVPVGVGTSVGVEEGMKKVDVTVGGIVFKGVGVIVCVGNSAVGIGKVGVLKMITSVIKRVGVGETVNLAFAVLPTHKMIVPKK